MKKTDGKLDNLRFEEIINVLIQHGVMTQEEAKLSLDQEVVPEDIILKIKSRILLNGNMN